MNSIHTAVCNGRLQVAKALGFELYYDTRGYDVESKTDCTMFIVSDRLE